MRGRVLRVSGLQCLVDVGLEEWQCALRGKLKLGARTTNSPVVTGDLVEVAAVSKRVGVVESVYPRHSLFSRLASGSRPGEQLLAANIDTLIAMISLHNPSPRAGFIDRAIVMALKGNIEPSICINKHDLLAEGESDAVARTYLDLGYRVHLTSAKTGEGVEALRSVLKDRVTAFVGQSGVGKSSLLNRLQPGLAIKTDTTMKKHNRGKHTTTATHLYRLNSGGLVADTPGLKELGLWDVSRATLAEYFVEMEPLLQQCRFRNCLHLSEPGCVIRNAVSENRISSTRYAGYERIMQTLGE
jgi:ribosome biogenesis GTPase